MTIAEFRKTICDHYKKNPRPMPWRETHDPYRILVSEIMLQQTQVARVKTFYKNFIKQFPNVRALAAARTEDVLRAWKGLGYNRRALALKKMAGEIVVGCGGKLPRDTESLVALPGIGKYTAGAVRAFAFGEPDIFIETNIRRVFIHFFFPRKKKVTDAELARYIQRTLDEKNPREWYYALMDYGAMLGESARMKKIVINPNRRSAHYSKQSKFAGSDRELRGKILALLLEKKKIRTSLLARQLKEAKRVPDIISKLSKEGFIMEKSGHISLSH